MLGVKHYDIVRDVTEKMPWFEPMICVASNLDRLIFKRYAWGIVYEREAIVRGFDR